MKTIHIEDLLAEGYREDLDGLDVFQKRHFRPWTLVLLVILAIVPIVWIVLGMAEHLQLYALATSGFFWAIVFSIMITGALAHPTSRHTGKRLLKFKNEPPARNSLVEIVYVCPDSKTYFVQVYLSSDRVFKT